MVWQQDSDVQMGFGGFSLTWSRAELQAARSDAGPLARQLLIAQVPGGWDIPRLQAVMAALLPSLTAWQAALPGLTPAHPNRRFMLQQMTEALAAPWPTQ